VCSFSDLALVKYLANYCYYLVVLIVIFIVNMTTSPKIAGTFNNSYSNWSELKVMGESDKFVKHRGAF